MPRRIVPSCGYIREVCYNDCAPSVRAAPQRKTAKSTVSAEKPSPEPTATPESHAGALLLGLLLWYCLQ